MMNFSKSNMTKKKAICFSVLIVFFLVVITIVAWILVAGHEEKTCLGIIIEDDKVHNFAQFKPRLQLFKSKCIPFEKKHARCCKVTEDAFERNVKLTATEFLDLQVMVVKLQSKSPQSTEERDLISISAKVNDITHDSNTKTSHEAFSQLLLDLSNAYRKIKN